ncbi:hypothetical protein GCM10025886_11690 [Tetragenococcus halophilus subsp. flandriensis]|uniref:Uncharacterized protein n=2 Tax=Bacilli TaxID=91061 RepID=A0AA37XJM4_9ENTE|nr:hypothetical protein GCM10025886_11690 [Tetragenococcus halophilus subsp. flandriensis]GMA45813.1 hypothetical protein GCM10025854_00590 [Tetragenococcus muriaticus]GMA53323.1 hypothetical protein GCM10025857_46800 [Alicyclobacillus contaminans]GMA71286.1 hypothetical protein GCM10025885_03350 [Tetragenococcus osmophilus]GMQ74138.1 hypothetical protein TEHSL10_17740 [Tetragenococcus halophilus]
MGSCFDIVWFLRYNSQWKGSTWDCAISSCSSVYAFKHATQTVVIITNTLSVSTFGQAYLE